MKGLTRLDLMPIIALAALAGFIDAVGFLALGGRFLSFMSGNSTHLALSLADQSLALSLEIAAIIMLFIFGVMCGVVINRIKRHKAAFLWVLGSLCLVLLVAAGAGFFAQQRLSLSLCCVAMGMTNALYLREDGSSLALTYMTGALVKIGQALALRLLQDRTQPLWPYVFQWSGLIFGGVSGAVCFAHFGLKSLSLACLLAWGVFAMALVRERGKAK